MATDCDVATNDVLAFDHSDIDRHFHDFILDDESQLTDQDACNIDDLLDVFTSLEKEQALDSDATIAHSSPPCLHSSSHSPIPIQGLHTFMPYIPTVVPPVTTPRLLAQPPTLQPKRAPGLYAKLSSQIPVVLLSATSAPLPIFSNSLLQIAAPSEVSAMQVPTSDSPELAISCDPPCLTKTERRIKILRWQEKRKNRVWLKRGLKVNKNRRAVASKRQRADGRFKSSSSWVSCT